MEFRRYHPADLAAIDLQPSQRDWRARTLDGGYAEALAGHYAWTGLVGDRVVGCAGLVLPWECRGVAWAFFGVIPRPEWLSVVRKVRSVFAEAERNGITRIETTVVRGFGNGCRLAQAVGLEVEGLLNRYGPNREDHIQFARIAA